eukprot:3380281-Rhodomonas_salina.1
MQHVRYKAGSRIVLDSGGTQDPEIKYWRTRHQHFPHLIQDQIPAGLVHVCSAQPAQTWANHTLGQYCTWYRRRLVQYCTWYHPRLVQYRTHHRRLRGTSISQDSSGSGAIIRYVSTGLGVASA